MIVSMLGLRAPGAEGGVEMAVAALAPRLAKRGIRVRIICRKGWLSPDFHAPGVDLVEVAAPRGAGWEALAHSFLGLPAALRGADLLHLHAAGPGGLAPLARLAGKPVVVTLHGEDWARSRWGTAAAATLRAAWTAAQTADAIIAVSTSLLPAVAPVGATWIPNGVDSVPFAPLEAAGVPGLKPGFWLVLGRIVREKNVETAIRAHAAIRGAPPLVIVGSSAHDPREVARLAKAAGPGVVFTGPRFGGSKAALLHGAALMICPSTLEGLPLAVLEAMSAGTPVIASDIPPHRELLGAAVGPAPADLAGWIAALRGFDPVAARRDAAARASAVQATWSWDRVADRTEAVYRGVLSRCRHAM